MCSISSSSSANNTKTVSATNDFLVFEAFSTEIAAKIHISRQIA